MNLFGKYKGVETAWSEKSKDNMHSSLSSDLVFLRWPEGKIPKKTNSTSSYQDNNNYFKLYRAIQHQWYLHSAVLSHVVHISAVYALLVLHTRKHLT